MMIDETGRDASNEGSEPVVPTRPQAPTPGVAPVPTPDAGLQDDMSRILGSVKLPERKGAGAAPAEPKKFYDTKLPGQGIGGAPEGMVVKPPAPTPEPDVKEAIVKEAMGLGHKQADIRPMHTLKDDLQEVVKEKKISLVRAVALEEQKRAQRPVQDMQPVMPRRWGVPVIVSLTLVSLGALALAAVFFVMQERAATESAGYHSSILFAEQSIPLPVDNLTPNDVRRTLAAARQSTMLTLGAIVNIVPIREYIDPATNVSSMVPLTFAQFLEVSGARAPEELKRALGDEFFLGIHTVDENAPVIIATVGSYERAFAGMLQWEKDMNADLSPFFTTVPRNKQDASGLILEREFEDTVMRNYDVRTLRDDAGTIELYYAFPTRSILIIAESPYSFTEVLSRLRADRRL